MAPQYCGCRNFNTWWAIMGQYKDFMAVASERSQHCGGKVRPKGPKLEARSLGEVAYHPSHQVWGLREHGELP